MYTNERHGSNKGYTNRVQWIDGMHGEWAGWMDENRKLDGSWIYAVCFTIHYGAQYYWLNGYTFHHPLIGEREKRDMALVKKSICWLNSFLGLFVLRFSRSLQGKRKECTAQHRTFLAQVWFSPFEHDPKKIMILLTKEFIELTFNRMIFGCLNFSFSHLFSK